jgi:hypothetical protein
MRRAPWITFVGAALFALSAMSAPAIAAGGPPEGKGKKGDVGKSVEGFLYGALYVIERDGNGEPFIYTTGACAAGGCAQPLMADCSYVPIMCNYVGDWTQDPELIACLIANGVEDPLGEVDPENLWEPGPCDLHPCYVDAVQEVRFGRLSVARTTQDVILKAYDEALSEFNSALGVGQDLAGRVVLDLPLLDDEGTVVLDPDGAVVTYEKTIDSPLENLALYRELMINFCLGGVMVEFIGEGGATVTEMHYLEPAAIALLEADPVLKSLVCDYALTDRSLEGWWQTPVTPAVAVTAADHDLAASFLAAAGDKEGHVTLDMVINANTYLGINPYVEPAQGQPPVLTYHEFVTEDPGFDWYQYSSVARFPADASATLLGPAVDECTEGTCFCVGEVSPFGAGPELVDFGASAVPVCRGGALLASGGSPVYCRATAGDAPGIATDLLLHANSLDPGCGGANWFTQAAEDARQVIWFLHNWKVPEYETP